VATSKNGINFRIGALLLGTTAYFPALSASATVEAGMPSRAAMARMLSPFR
jgi:hypothetical protein